MTGWPPETVTPAVAGVVLYLYDATLYDPLLTPQGHRGSPNFVAGRWSVRRQNRLPRSSPLAVAFRDP